jgi:hypothetical protein
VQDGFEPDDTPEDEDDDKGKDINLFESRIEYPTPNSNNLHDISGPSKVFGCTIFLKPIPPPYALKKTIEFLL